MKLLFITSLTIIILCLTVKPVFAIVPPPILINVGVSVLEVLAVIFSIFLQGFLVIFGGKKNKKFTLKPLHLIIAVILFLLAFFMYINTYKLLIKDKYNYLTKNMYKLPDEDHYITTKDTVVFNISEDPSDVEDDYKPPPPGVNIDEIYDKMFSEEAVFIDIRDQRQYMACTIKGAVNIPENELPNKIAQYRDKEIYIFGNGDIKSAKLAQQLEEQGYKAFYIARGIRWFAALGSGFFLYDNEGRDISMMPRFFLESQREKWNIPQGKLSHRVYTNLDEKIFFFDNTHKLWTTTDIKKKIKNHSIILIDVRTTADKHEYLFPIPVSALTIEEIERKIEEIPQNKEIIIACNDFSTAFEAEWLGAELDRRGLNYQGRYTNPEELFLPPPQMIIPFHFTFERFAEYIQFGYQHLQFYIGNRFHMIPGRTPLLFYAFIVFILILRLALLPLSFLSSLHKAKTNKLLRDKVKKGITVPSGFFEKINYINNLQEENLFLKLLYVIPDILIITLAVITGFFVVERSSFLAPWIRDAQIPSVIIALVTSCLFYIYELCSPLNFKMANNNTRPAVFRLMPMVFSAIMFLLGAFFLPAVFTAFLGVNYFISILEYNFSKIFVKPQKDKSAKKKEPAEIIASEKAVKKFPFDLVYLLSDPETNHPPFVLSKPELKTSIGGKAYNLAVMAGEKLNIPSGFVISEEFFQKFPMNDGKLTPEAMEELFKAWDYFKFEEAIVRSSSTKEDGSQKSYAGIFESIPGMIRDNFIEGVEKVYNSYCQQRAKTYVSGDNEDFKPQGGVIVQEMIRPDYMGVLFTVDPQDPVNMSLDFFTGEEAARNMETTPPTRVVIGRLSEKTLNIHQENSAIKNLPIADIIETGKQLEKIFKNPQDIEWAVKDNTLYIFQSRNITYSPPLKDKYIIEEKIRLLKKVSDYKKNTDSTESGLPGIIWKTNEISEVLPCPLPSSLSLFRKMWLPNSSIEMAYRYFCLPCNLEIKPEDILETLFGKLYINDIEEKKLLLAGSLENRMAALCGKINIEIRKKNLCKKIRFSAPEFLDTINKKLENSQNFFNIAKDTVEHLLTEHLVQVFKINIILDYYLKLINKDLKNSGITFNDLLNSSSEKSTVDKIKLCEDCTFRAPCDYELSCPRFIETPSILKNINGNSEKQQPATKDKKAVDPRQIMKNAGIQENKIKRILQNLKDINPYVRLKESERILTTKYIAFLRKIFLKIDETFRLGGDIFYLTIDEIWEMENKGVLWETKKTISQRKKKRERFKEIELPLNIRVEDVEKTGLCEKSTESTDEEGALQGIMVSGNRSVQGTARIAKTLEEVKDISPDEILVAKMASTQWSVILPGIKGIITQGGGMLSHLAILAREFKTPYIAGCKNAASIIKNGETITIHPNGKIEKSP